MMAAVTIPNPTLSHTSSVRVSRALGFTSLRQAHSATTTGRAYAAEYFSQNAKANVTPAATRCSDCRVGTASKARLAVIPSAMNGSH